MLQLGCCHYNWIKMDNTSHLIDCVNFPHYLKKKGIESSRLRFAIGIRGLSNFYMNIIRGIKTPTHQCVSYLLFRKLTTNEK